MVRFRQVFTISSVVCGVHRRTSSDCGKGLSSSWLYTDRTVLYISPTILWSELNRRKVNKLQCNKVKENKSTLESFKCSQIRVHSTFPLIRLPILQWKSVLSWGRQFGSIYLSAYEILPDNRGGLWWEWLYNMGTTTGFNEMIEKDIISHKELKLELCSIVGSA